MSCITNCPILSSFPTQGCSYGYDIVLVPYSCKKCAEYMCLPIENSILQAGRAMAITFMTISVFIVLFLSYSLVHERFLCYLSKKKRFRWLFKNYNNRNSANMRSIQAGFRGQYTYRQSQGGTIYANGTDAYPSSYEYKDQRDSIGSIYSVDQEAHKVDIYQIQPNTSIRPFAVHLDSTIRGSNEPKKAFATVLDLGTDPPNQKNSEPSVDSKEQDLQFIDIDLAPSVKATPLNYKRDRKDTMLMQPISFQKIEINHSLPKVFSILQRKKDMLKQQGSEPKQQ
ncbi:hypothetical protein BB561_005143 [Smittium simulii]|uniref:Uncharacterized protein n=1 Tax=Smittium simulii TaxID=133385 RepID=A0A2T9YC37_9FUNG|nr:hypothetical protein BB561_005143 [Smittium simulii]